MGRVCLPLALRLQPPNHDAWTRTKVKGPFIGERGVKGRGQVCGPAHSTTGTTEQLETPRQGPVEAISAALRRPDQIDSSLL